MGTLDIIALSDCHLTSNNPIGRKDKVTKTQWKKLRFIFDYARKNNAIILQAGDFVNKSRDWDILFTLINFFREYQDIPFYCVQGQHDGYFYSGIRETTMGVLENMGLIKILDSDYKNPFKEKTWNIYGSGWGESLPSTTSKNNILITHRSISYQEYYPHQSYIIPKKFLKNNPEYNIVIVGDIHRSFYVNVGDRIIINTGPMLRLEANQYNLNEHIPHFYHIKLSHKGIVNLEKIEIPHRAGDEVLTRLHIPQSDNDQIDTTNLSRLIEKSVDISGNKINLKKLFNDKNIKPRIKHLLKDIYNKVTNDE